MADNQYGSEDSRTEVARFRELSERQKSANPAYAYFPRWIPTGNWHLSVGDLIVILFGLAIIVMVLGMRLFGVIH